MNLSKQVEPCSPNPEHLERWLPSGERRSLPVLAEFVEPSSDSDSDSGSALGTGSGGSGSDSDAGDGNTPTAAQWINLILTTDFTDSAAVTHPTDILQDNKLPYIPLGTINNHAYRLSPTPNPLSLHATKTPDPEDYRSLLPGSLISINLTVPASVNSPSIRSSIVNGGGRNSRLGFVFFQIGELEVCPTSDLERFTGGPTDERIPWTDTGFVLVVKIGEDGRAGEVYILCNFHPECEEGMNVNVDVRNEEWGRLGGVGRQIVGAKIANQFEELGHGREIQLVEVPSGHELELVRVVRETDDGSLVRQFCPGRIELFASLL